MNISFSELFVSTKGKIAKHNMKLILLKKLVLAVLYPKLAHFFIPTQIILKKVG